MSGQVHAYSLGLVPYGKALDLQQQLVELRRDDRIEDTVLLLRHPHVITLGRPQSERFLRYPAAELARSGYPVVQAGRGGEVTYHGPDQLILYPIVKLRGEEKDLHLYLRNLEEVGIGVCRSLGLTAGRVKGRTGVWVEDRKVAAIGVRARHWVTFHGMAVNHGPDLKGFDLIVPCGISDAEVGSLETLSGRRLEEAALEETVLEEFGRVFEREIVRTEDTWPQLARVERRP